jgi:hypothetical protein
MPNMDGPEGERHVELGASIMGLLFDYPTVVTEVHCYLHFTEDQFAENLAMIHQLKDEGNIHDLGLLGDTGFFIRYWKEDHTWENFARYHSRFYARQDEKPFSRLCVADKYAFALTPWWIYLPMVRLTGEIHEYIELSKQRTAAGEPKYASQKLSTDSHRQWLFDCQEYAHRWVMEHKDGRPDTWTPKITSYEVTL